MATTSDPRASGFDATKFRDGIKFAMSMGLPENSSERVTFRWKTTYSFGIEDTSGNPYDFTSVPEQTFSKDDVLVVAAVEFIPVSKPEGTSMGQFESPEAIITVLDEEYVLVSDADEVLLGGNTYKITYTAPPIGLFGVTVYQIHAIAVDES